MTRGYIDLDCALLLTNHMLNYITITLLVAIAIAIMIDLSSGLQIHRLNVSLCTYYIDVNVDRINKDSDSDSDSVVNTECQMNNKFG